MQLHLSFVFSFILLVVNVFGNEMEFSPPTTLGSSEGTKILPNEDKNQDVSILPINTNSKSESDETPTRDLPSFNFPSDDDTGRPTGTQNYQNQNIACTKNHDPLCGSDGKTYNNMCEFAQAQLGNPQLRIARRRDC